MNLKNSIYKLSFAAMISMMAMNATEIQAQGVVPAQKGEKAFTLEDLNFGGNNYRNMVAKNRWCTWWGNELIHQDIEACYLVNKTTGKETKLFGINDIKHHGNEKAPTTFVIEASLLKGGGYLLSRIALQYHRRKWA